MLKRPSTTQKTEGKRDVKTSLSTFIIYDLYICIPSEAPTEALNRIEYVVACLTPEIIGSPMSKHRLFHI